MTAFTKVRKLKATQSSCEKGIPAALCPGLYNSVACPLPSGENTPTSAPPAWLQEASQHTRLCVSVMAEGAAETEEEAERKGLRTGERVPGRLPKLCCPVPDGGAVSVAELPFSSFPGNQSEKVILKQSVSGRKPPSGALKFPCEAVTHSSHVMCVMWMNLFTPN